MRAIFPSSSTLLWALPPLWLEYTLLCLIMQFFFLWTISASCNAAYGGLIFCFFKDEIEILISRLRASACTREWAPHRLIFQDLTFYVWTMKYCAKFCFWDCWLPVLLCLLCCNTQYIVIILGLRGGNYWADVAYNDSEAFKRLTDIAV